VCVVNGQQSAKINHLRQYLVEQNKFGLGWTKNIIYATVHMIDRMQLFIGVISWRESFVWFGLFIYLFIWYVDGRPGYHGATTNRAKSIETTHQ
jgi:hypothetical protein